MRTAVSDLEKQVSSHRLEIDYNYNGVNNPTKDLDKALAGEEKTYNLYLRDPSGNSGILLQKKLDRMVKGVDYSNRWSIDLRIPAETHFSYSSTA